MSSDMVAVFTETGADRVNEVKFIEEIKNGQVEGFNNGLNWASGVTVKDHTGEISGLAY